MTFFALSGPGSGFDTTIRAVANALVKEKLVKVPLPIENSQNSIQAMTLAATVMYVQDGLRHLRGQDPGPSS